MSDGRNGTGDPAFGARLKAAREAAGLSQSQLAAKVGLEQNSISDFETGRSMPAARTTLPALARAVEASVDFLLDGVGGDVANEVEHLLKRIPRKTWRKIGKMTPTELALIARQLEALVEAQVPVRPDGPTPRKPRRS